MALGEQFGPVLAAARAGDEDACTTLYRDLTPDLLRYVASRDRSVADDVIGETWLALARLLPTFEGEEQDLRRLAFSIAHRRTVEHWRKAGRRRTDPVDAADLAAIGDADADPELIVGEQLDREAALALLRAHLRDDELEVVLLRVVAGMSAEETGLVVGRSAGAVRVVQHRALRRLAEALGDPAAIRGV